MKLYALSALVIRPDPDGTVTMDSGTVILTPLVGYRIAETEDEAIQHYREAATQVYPAPALITRITAIEIPRETIDSVAGA